LANGRSSMGGMMPPEVRRRRRGAPCAASA
jgi:hypothetical protein